MIIILLIILVIAILNKQFQHFIVVWSAVIVSIIVSIIGAIVFFLFSPVIAMIGVYKALTSKKTK
jgi:hypothetical protein